MLHFTHLFHQICVLQDTFLPHIEDGTVTLIGATTENPSFQVNNALLSRCKVIVLEKHSSENIEAILRTAIQTLNVSEEKDSGDRPQDGNKNEAR